MEQWHEIFITDKTGGKFFKGSTSPLSTMSEIRNLKQHLRQAEKYPQHYKFLDLATAFIVLDGEKYND